MRRRCSCQSYCTRVRRLVGFRDAFQEHRLQRFREGDRDCVVFSASPNLSEDLLGKACRSTVRFEAFRSYVHQHDQARLLPQSRVPADVLVPSREQSAQARLFDLGLRSFPITVSVLGSRLGRLSGWRRCSSFVTRFPHDLACECLSSDVSERRDRVGYVNPSGCKDGASAQRRRP